MRGYGLGLASSHLCRVRSTQQQPERKTSSQLAKHEGRRKRRPSKALARRAV